MLLTFDNKDFLYKITKAYLEAFDYDTSTIDDDDIIYCLRYHLFKLFLYKLHDTEEMDIIWDFLDNNDKFAECFELHENYIYIDEFNLINSYYFACDMNDIEHYVFEEEIDPCAYDNYIFELLIEEDLENKKQNLNKFIPN